MTTQKVVNIKPRVEVCDGLKYATQWWITVLYLLQTFQAKSKIMILISDLRLCQCHLNCWGKRYSLQDVVKLLMHSRRPRLHWVTCSFVHISSTAPLGPSFLLLPYSDISEGVFSVRNLYQRKTLSSTVHLAALHSTIRRQQPSEKWRDLRAVDAVWPPLINLL